VAPHEQFDGSEAGIPRSRLMDYLPAVYHEVDASDRASEHLLRRFLLAFEQILLGAEESGHGKKTERADGIEGLEHCVARLHTFFDPEETREDFLSWLGGWVALDLRSDLPVSRRRALLANIVPLYQIRGTKRYLEELLHLYFDAPVVVDDSELPRFQIAVHSSLGRDTYVEGGPPYFFRVRLEISGTPRELETHTRMAREVIDLAKPAHTMYSLEVIHRREGH
jgi:phage tail-like protein